MKCSTGGGTAGQSWTPREHRGVRDNQTTPKATCFFLPCRSALWHAIRGMEGIIADATFRSEGWVSRRDAAALLRGERPAWSGKREDGSEGDWRTPLSRLQSWHSRGNVGHIPGLGEKNSNYRARSGDAVIAGQKSLQAGPHFWHPDHGINNHISVDIIIADDDLPRLPFLEIKSAKRNERPGIRRCLAVLIHLHRFRPASMVNHDGNVGRRIRISRIT